jgi:S-adenosylmethionine-diacylglycerol 3-amino-3-carboxypropyl transferase
VSVRLGLKFAVVREDPLLEARLIDAHHGRRVLLVASGGCTALYLLARDPSLQVSCFDMNPRQLEHVRDKAAAAGDRERLAVLNQSGEFEGLFQTLRQMLITFVTGEHELARFFDAPLGERAALIDAWSTHRYWPGCFAACFSDGLLHAMFGPAATQHAEPGSYPSYFAALFERGLRRDDAAHNPFLQHVLLGAHRETPVYASRAPELILGSLDAVPELERFDLYSLSNIFDWSDDTLVADWAARLKRAARPGSLVLMRQLNNTRDLRRHFAPEFSFDDTLGRELQSGDRSLFYNRVEVARRV